MAKFWLFSATLWLVVQTSLAAPLHVLIDPGHGGSDSGAVRGTAREADIALKVAEFLRQTLNTDPQFKTSLTRSGDQTVPLTDRMALVEKTKADLLLSIHANASPDKKARGVEFYFQNHLPPDEETLFLAANENRLEKNSEISASDSDIEPTKKNDMLSILEDLRRQYRMKSSLKLSRKLLNSWNNEPGREANAIRQAPFYMVSKAQVPSVLVELGFITNAKEADRLVDPNYQREIAARIYRGLKDYKEMIDKTELAPLKSSP